jgi:hypothetical protein
MAAAGDDVIADDGTVPSAALVTRWRFVKI